jgi:hypothetical protein
MVGIVEKRVGHWLSKAHDSLVLSIRTLNRPSPLLDLPTLDRLLVAYA